MSGGIDDIDAHAAPCDSAIFGSYSDASFTFKLHAVHDAIIDLLICAEHAALFKHAVDKGRLAVIDMGYDGDVANRIVACSHCENLVLYLYILQDRTAQSKVQI